jgi:hypothetical protein
VPARADHQQIPTARLLDQHGSRGALDGATLDLNVAGAGAAK